MITCDNLIELRKWVAATAKLMLDLRSQPNTKNFLRTIAADYCRRVAERRKTSSATRWWRTKWRPKKKFTELPASSQRKALNVKIVLDEAYYPLVEMGLPPGYTEELACFVWQLIFRKSICRETIRRKVARIEECGGPDSAPIEAYADQLSLPRRKEKSMNEAAAATLTATIEE